jgi:hypothetical protein
MTLRLVSDDVLASAVARLAERGESINGYALDMVDHPVAGPCLRNYLVLTERPELLGEHGLLPAELFWSRYYWLVRFARIWSAVVGHDAGVEQQVFQLVEYSPYGLDALLEVEAAAERAAAEHLRAAAIR